MAPLEVRITGTDTVQYALHDAHHPCADLKLLELPAHAASVALDMSPATKVRT